MCQNILIKNFCFKGDPDTCTTEDGTPCIFPFRSNGGLRYTCQPYPGVGKEWCATAVGKNSEFLEGPDTWGVCGSDCPTSFLSDPIKFSSSEENIVSKDVIEFQDKDNAWKCKSYLTLFPMGYFPTDFPWEVVVVSPN